MNKNTINRLKNAANKMTGNASQSSRPEYIQLLDCVICGQIKELNQLLNKKPNLASGFIHNELQSPLIMAILFNQTDAAYRIMHSSAWVRHSESLKDDEIFELIKKTMPIVGNHRITFEKLFYANKPGKHTVHPNRKNPEMPPPSIGNQQLSLFG